MTKAASRFFSSAVVRACTPKVCSKGHVPAILLVLLSCSCFSQAQPLSEISADELSDDEFFQNDVATVVEPDNSRAFTRTHPQLGGQSLTIGMDAWVRDEPFANAKILGMLGVNTHVLPRSQVKNSDCPVPWLELEPKGFVCAPAKPSQQPPSSKLPRETVRGLPGKYAVATDQTVFYQSVEDALYGMGGRAAMGDMVKRRASIPIEDGTRLWRTERNEYVDPTTLRHTRGSAFSGVDLRVEGAPKLPFAFVMNSTKHRSKVSVYRAPTATSRLSKQMPARTVVEILGESTNSEYWEIPNGKFIRKEDVRVVEKQPTPATLSVGGKWIDVDLERQLVVAYVGDNPVFATLASTGKGKNLTPSGVYNITRKKLETTMRSDRSKEQRYSVAVPWAVYFNEAFAFHAAYWHNGFGTRQSHGCVNLTPADAAQIFHFVGPSLPVGWTAVHSHESQPGTIVWVH